MNKYTVLIFSRANYELTTLDVKARNEEHAIEVAEVTFRNEYGDEDWDDGECAAIYSHSADCDSAIGSLP